MIRINETFDLKNSLFQRAHSHLQKDLILIKHELYEIGWVKVLSFLEKTGFRRRNLFSTVAIKSMIGLVSVKHLNKTSNETIVIDLSKAFDIHITSV